MENSTFMLTGRPGTGKSTFVSAYLKLFASQTLLIDGREMWLAIDGKSQFLSDKMSPENVVSYKQCLVLIIDELFLLLNSLHSSSILEIITYRVHYKKDLIVVGFESNFVRCDFPIIKKIYSTAIKYNFTKETSISQVLTNFYLQKYKMDIKRVMRFYLLQVVGSSYRETGVELFLHANEWNEFLRHQDAALLYLLEEGQFQCVATDLHGDHFYCADVPLLKGKEYLKQLLNCANLPHSADIKLNTILKTWNSDGDKVLHFGVDIYKNHE